MSEETQEFNFATVGEVYADGLTLTFDGESTPTEKHYKCNSACKFEAGQRVRVIKDSGTYVAEYPVGAPMTSLTSDNALKLNNKTESQLSVSYAATAGSVASAASATRANQVINQSNASETYDLFFRASSSTTLQFKYGAYGQWRNITTTA